MNTHTSNYQIGSKAARDTQGGFVVVWTSADHDLRNEDVFGQRFELLALAPTPTLSVAGIGAGVIALLAAGAAALRHRRRGW